jgi:hypothetical protein
MRAEAMGTTHRRHQRGAKAERVDRIFDVCRWQWSDTNWGAKRRSRVLKEARDGRGARGRNSGGCGQPPYKKSLTCARSVERRNRRDVGALASREGPSRNASAQRSESWQTATFGAEQVSDVPLGEGLERRACRAAAEAIAAVGSSDSCQARGAGATATCLMRQHESA